MLMTFVRRMSMRLYVCTHTLYSRVFIVNVILQYIYLLRKSVERQTQIVYANISTITSSKVTAVIGKHDVYLMKT